MKLSTTVLALASIVATVSAAPIDSPSLMSVDIRGSTDTAPAAFVYEREAVPEPAWAPPKSDPGGRRNAEPEPAWAPPKSDPGGRRNAEPEPAWAPPKSDPGGRRDAQPEPGFALNKSGSNGQ